MRTLLAALAEEPMLRPVRCATFGERLKVSFSSDRLDEIVDQIWEHGIEWRSKGSGECWCGNGPGHVDATMTWKVPAQKSFEVGPIERVFRRLIRDLPVDFAMIHPTTSHELTKYRPSYHERVQHLQLGFGTRQLVRCLPQLPWATLFGPPYLELFGLETLRSCPAARIEEWSERAVYVKLTPEPADVAERFEEFDAARARAKEHLGPDCFYSEDRRRFRVPRFQGIELPRRRVRG